MKSFFFSSFLFLSVLLNFSCELKQEDDKQPESFNRISGRKNADLGVPDSIDTHLIAATYYDEESKTNSIILYNDTNKKEAKRITFLRDTIDVDILKLKKENEFQSIHNHAEYIISTKTVTYYYKYFNSSTIIHFERLD